MKKIVMAGALFALSTIWVGCDSKFVETSPESVKLSGISLDERLNLKAAVDERINLVEQGAEKVKRIVDLFKKIQDPNGAQELYTPIDFLLDVNSELKAKIPENREGRLVRYSKVELPISALSKECKTLKTSLETSVIYAEETESATPKQGEKQAIGERLTYSFMSCASDEKYLVAVEADWVGDSLDIKLNNKNLESVFKDILINDLLEDSSCKITQDDKKIIDKIQCSNLKVNLSETEDAIVSEMQFSNSGEIRFEAFADIYGLTKKKATSLIRVFASGDVKFELNKVEEQDADKK